MTYWTSDKSVWKPQTELQMSLKLYILIVPSMNSSTIHAWLHSKSTVKVVQNYTSITVTIDLLYLPKLLSDFRSRQAAHVQYARRGPWPSPSYLQTFSFSAALTHVRTHVGGQKREKDMVQVKYLKDKRVTVPHKALIKMSCCHGDYTSRKRVLVLVGTRGGGALKSHTRSSGNAQAAPRSFSQSGSASSSPCTSNFFGLTRETVNRIAALNSPLIPSYLLHWREMKVKVGPDLLLCFSEVGGCGALTCRRSFWQTNRRRQQPETSACTRLHPSSWLCCVRCCCSPPLYWLWNVSICSHESGFSFFHRFSMKLLLQDILPHSKNKLFVNLIVHLPNCNELNFQFSAAIKNKNRIRFLYLTYICKDYFSNKCETVS